MKHVYKKTVAKTLLACITTLYSVNNIQAAKKSLPPAAAPAKTTASKPTTPQEKKTNNPTAAQAQSPKSQAPIAQQHSSSQKAPISTPRPVAHKKHVPLPAAKPLPKANQPGMNQIKLEIDGLTKQLQQAQATVTAINTKLVEAQNRMKSVVFNTQAK